MQLSVLIGKIARLDCPRSWPQLIPVLLEAIRVTDPLCQQRALQTLYTVVKSLASRRLPPDRKVFEDVRLTCLLLVKLESHCVTFCTLLLDHCGFSTVMAIKQVLLFNVFGCFKIFIVGI